MAKRSSTLPIPQHFPMPDVAMRGRAQGEAVALPPRAAEDGLDWSAEEEEHSMHVTAQGVTDKTQSSLTDKFQP